MALAPATAPRPTQSPAPGASSATIVAAVRDLYRASHLPDPRVYCARDVTDFGQAVRRLHRDDPTIWVFVPLMNAVLITEAALAITGMHGSGLASGCTAIFIVPWLPTTSRHFEPFRAASTSVIGRALIIAGSALLSGSLTLFAGRTLLVSADRAGAVAGLWASLVMTSDMLRPALARFRFQARVARLSLLHLVWGCAPANPILVPRLLGALDNLPRDDSRVRLVGLDRRDNNAAREQIRAALREIERTPGFGRAPPILGRCTERWSTPGIWMARAAENCAEITFIRDPAGRGRAHGPGGSRFRLPLHRRRPSRRSSFASSSPRAPGGIRRSRRAPWWAVLQSLSETRPGLELAIDLAPGERVADRLLARRIVREGDSRSRARSITAMGVGRFMQALVPKPVQEDAWGCLFQVGPRDDPSHVR